MTEQTTRAQQDGSLGGRPVHRVGYGAMQLESSAHRDGGREQALNLLRRAVEWGVDHIDTASFYGDAVVNGLIREALHPYPEQLVLVSKVGAAHKEGGRLPIVPAQRPAELRTAVETDLRTLGVERVDVVNLRRIDGGRGIRASGEQVVDLDSQLAELVALREQGKIGAIGLSNVSVAQLRQALPAGIACVQNYYSLLERSDEPLLAACHENHVAWVPFFSLGSASFPNVPSVIEHPAVRQAAETVGATPSQVGLAWLLAHDPNVLVIPGTSNPEHLKENLAAADLRLDPATMATLDGLAEPTVS